MRFLKFQKKVYFRLAKISAISPWAFLKSFCNKCIYRDFPAFHDRFRYLNQSKFLFYLSCIIFQSYGCKNRNFRSVNLVFFYDFRICDNSFNFAIFSFPKALVLLLRHHILHFQIISFISCFGDC